MRYAKIMVMVLAFSLIGIPRGVNSATDAVFPVTASIEQQLELTGWMKRLGPGETDPGTEGTEIGFPDTMAFGDTPGGGYLTSELSDGSDAGGLYSPHWYAIFMVAKTSGRAYTIESQANSFAGTSGSAIGHNLDTSWVLTPEYNQLDEWVWTGGSAPQGPDPNAGTTGYDVGDQTLAVGTHLIYNSGTGGASRILRAFYSLPPYPDPSDPPAIAARPAGWTIVDASKPTGNYESTVTISLTLN
jgi:hypothetical protein